jgi:hypothetical protein
MKKNTSTYLPLTSLVVIFVFLGIFLFSYDQYPIDDDWSYIKAAETFHHTGEMKFTPWTAMSLVFQIWWGTFFTKLFGYSIEVLRLSTLVISLAGLIFMYLLLQELGYGWRNSFLAVLLLLFNPFSFPLNFTFFSDHFFITLLFSASYFYYRAFKENREFLLIIASLATCAAILIRQNGILIAVAALIYLVIYERSLRHIIKNGLLIALLPLISMFVFTYWFNSVHGPTSEYLRQIEQIIANVKKPHLLFAQIIWRLLLILEFLGFCLLPLSVSLLPSLKEVVNRQHNFFLLLFCLAGTLCYLMFDHIGLYPASVDLWLHGFRFAYISEYGYRDSFHIMFFFYTLLDFLSLASVVYLVYLIITHRETVRKAFALRSPSFFILLVGAVQVMFLLITMYKFSRYYLILIPFVIMPILTIAQRITVHTKVLISLLAFYALFSFAVTQDVMSWNQCKWQIAQSLLYRGIPPQKISAGFTWDAWHCSQYSIDHPYEIVPQNGDIPWWIEKLTPAVDPCYLVSNSPVPTGFEVLSYFATDRYAVIDSANYLSRFHLRNMKVYVLERLPRVEEKEGSGDSVNLLNNLKGAACKGAVPAGAVKQLSVEMGGIVKSGWLQSAPSAVSFRLRLPHGRCRLSAALGMMPSCWYKEGDGALCKITINDNLFENVFTAPGEASTAQLKNFLRLRSIFLTPRNYFLRFIDAKQHPDERAWQNVSLDLSPFAGKVIDISFEVSGGPRNDDRYDEVVWGEPVIHGY